jgi:tetratricopeptide (TPR) repeat protein
MAWAYNNRGNVSKNKGDIDRAVADADQAIRLDPKHAMAHNNRGFPRGKSRHICHSHRSMAATSFLAMQSKNGRDTWTE